jgi:hypothetical protein
MERFEILAGKGTLVRGHDEEPHRRLQAPPAFERQIGAAERVLTHD